MSKADYTYKDKVTIYYLVWIKPLMLITYCVPSMKQYWLAVIWTCLEKRLWHFNKNKNIFLQKYVFKTIICEMFMPDWSTILFSAKIGHEILKYDISISCNNVAQYDISVLTICQFSIPSYVITDEWHPYGSIHFMICPHDGEGQIQNSSKTLMHTPAHIMKVFGQILKWLYT